VWIVLAAVVILPSCSGIVDESATRFQQSAATDVLRLATTTSARDSGLLDDLLPVFEGSSRCRVDIIAVGTGAALKLGEAGDVDIVLVHARESELAFMEAEHGIRHEVFMYNDFVLLGPEADAAQIRNIEPVEAMKRIAKGHHRFVSRGDESGTHIREMRLWEAAGGRPDWDAYIEGGQGMGPTLMMANELRGYVLADMGTHLTFRDKIELVPLSASADILRNPYAAIVVNPKKTDRINPALADAFVDFLISAQTQRRIQTYCIAGRQLFHPTRLDGDS
jgi:tungstate transport system substrate-binding protein